MALCYEAPDAATKLVIVIVSSVAFVFRKAFVTTTLLPKLGTVRTNKKVAAGTAAQKQASTQWRL